MGRTSLLLRVAMAWPPICCIVGANSCSKEEASPWPQMTASLATRRSVIWKPVKERYDLHPERLIADTAYGTGPLLGWLVDRKIAPHIPVLGAENYA